MNKRCQKCKQIKKTSEFWKNKRKKDGLASLCKTCSSQACRKYNKTKKGKERSILANKKRMKNQPHRCWSGSTLRGHRRKGNKINITLDKLEEIAKQSNNCEICGCELNWELGNKNRRAQSDSPTLDRIDNGNVISIDTIQILCHDCNMSKSNKTMVEFINYCEEVVKKFENKNIKTIISDI